MLAVAGEALGDRTADASSSSGHDHNTRSGWLHRHHGGSRPGLACAGLGGDLVFPPPLNEHAHSLLERNARMEADVIRDALNAQWAAGFSADEVDVDFGGVVGDPDRGAGHVRRRRVDDLLNALRDSTRHVVNVVS